MRLAHPPRPRGDFLLSDHALRHQRPVPRDRDGIDQGSCSSTIKCTITAVIQQRKHHYDSATDNAPLPRASLPSEEKGLSGVAAQRVPYRIYAGEHVAPRADAAELRFASFSLKVCGEIGQIDEWEPATLVSVATLLQQPSPAIRRARCGSSRSIDTLTRRCAIAMPCRPEHWMLASWSRPIALRC